MSDQPGTALTITDSKEFISMLERVAINPEVSVEKMHGVLDVQERMMNKAAEQAFNRDFALMQAELPVITKEGKIIVNREVRSTYARFEDINEQVKPVLEKHGFSIMFKVGTPEKRASVTGILMHRGGHRETATMELDADTSGSKNGVQALGSSLQYAKRYILCGLINITTSDDDDGSSAGVARVSKEQAAELRKMIDDLGADAAERAELLNQFLTFRQVNSLEEIAEQAFPDCKRALEAKKKAKK